MGFLLFPLMLGFVEQRAGYPKRFTLHVCVPAFSRGYFFTFVLFW
jgi:hypothetical protein